MSGSIIVGLEALLILGLFYGFCWHQLRYLKRDKAKRMAEKAKAGAAET